MSRLAVDDDVHEAERRAGKEIRHRAVVGDELQVHRIREARLDLTSVGVRRRVAVDLNIGPHLVRTGIAEPHQRVRIADRQLLEQQSVDGAEERRVGADAQGQRQHDDRRPAFFLQQHARGESKIS